MRTSHYTVVPPAGTEPLAPKGMLRGLETGEGLALFRVGTAGSSQSTASFLGQVRGQLF